MNSEFNFDTNAEVMDIWNISIVEELIKEIDPDVTDTEVMNIWNICNGNPWNARILYQLRKMQSTRDE